MERRIRIVGLCLMVAFALSAVAVASAQASVEIGQCVKTVKGAKGYKGHFKNKQCTEKASPEEIGIGGKANKYNFEPGGAPNPAFTAKGKAVTLKVGELEVTCKSSEANGTVRGGTGPSTLEAQFDFKSCIQPKAANKKCSTHGKEAGEIQTKQLVGSLTEKAAKEGVFTFDGKTKGDVGSETEVALEFECLETLYKVHGTLAGKDLQTENVPSKKGGVEFTTAVGTQNLVAVFPNPFTEVEEEEAVSLVFTQTIKFQGSYELKVE